jgi:hypothetical protein
MKRRRNKNPHAVALGRLGGLVRSEAKRRANRENGHKGGLVKSRKKSVVRPAQCATSPPWPQEVIEIVIASIRARFGDGAIGLGDNGIRFTPTGGAGALHARMA